MNWKKDLKKRLPVAIIIIVLLLPVIQKELKPFNEKKLKGYLPVIKKPELTVNSWNSQDYQIHEENYLKRYTGFHAPLIRLNSQIQFSVFRNPKAARIILGKDNQLFAVNYIHSYLGTNLVNRDTCLKKIKKLKAVSDKLAGKEIQLFIAIAPGKPIYMPENIPDKFIKNKQPENNYTLYTSLFKEFNIRYLDFVPLFKQAKDTSKYALFSKEGIHWSLYSCYMVCDTMLKFCEMLTNTELPDILSLGIAPSEKPRGSDRDISDAINLMGTLKQKNLAYHKIKIDTFAVAPELNILVMGDSFYWQPWSLGFDKAFKKHNFWFYNNEVYPKEKDKPLQNAKKLNLKEEIEKRDIIIIFTNETNLRNMAWGFIDSLYEEYCMNNK